MRQTPVNDYLEEISTELPEELYGNLSDAVYETVCDFDEEVAQLKAENAKLRHDLEDANNQAEEVCIENAKLLELLGGVGHLLFILDVDYCVACPRDSISHPCPVYTIKGGECLYKSDMRELGVEVD